MKSFAFYSSFAKIIIFLFSFVFSASSNTHKHFLQCQVPRISDYTSNSKSIIYTLNDPSYFVVLNSSIHNPRFSSSSTLKPFVIITPLKVSHVQATVYCSKKHGVQIRTRSGGHDAEGLSYVSNSVPFIVIYLRNLNLISPDVESESAWVQAGATLGELYYKISEESDNLGFPAGLFHTGGVGGHFSGGGYGFLTRKYGLAADNIIDAQLIKAQGRILDGKSIGEDLFWAIRGGGAESFGIVLVWKLRLVHVPSTVTVFDLKRDMKDATTKKLVHRWQNSANKVDEDLTIFLWFQTVNSIDKEGNTKIILQVTFQATFHGGVDRLVQLMQREFPELGLLRKECIEMSWEESILYFNRFRNGESLDALLNRTPGSNLFSLKEKSNHVIELIPDDMFESILARLYEVEVKRSWIDLASYGGKMNSESTIPFSHRAGILYNLRYLLMWEKEENITSERHLCWIRRLYNYMTPFVSKNPKAAYLNYRDLDI